MVSSQSSGQPGVFDSKLRSYSLSPAVDSITMKNGIPMDCRRFEEQLELLLAGELDADGVAFTEAHCKVCARCSRLLGIVRGDPDLTAAPDDGFVASLLQKTAGSACGRAEANLCAWVEGRRSL